MANKILIANQQIIPSLNKKEISYEYKDNFIPKIIIKILKNTNLDFNFEVSDTKLEVDIYVSDNCQLQLFEKKTGAKGKILFRYFLNKDSDVTINKIHDIDMLQERDFYYLNGSNAKITSTLKTVTSNKEKYDMTIEHNAQKTESNILNHAINFNGTTQINVTTIIPSGIKKCCANQNNRIINLTDNHCVIRPNLLIDEYDTEANHSAYIGPFDDENIFYMQRLGISVDDAKKLLIKGFLCSFIDSNKTEFLEKYWR